MSDAGAIGPTEFVRSADGTRIAWRRLGRGPAVVALHGGLGSSRSWEPVARRLADRCELFLVDRRGRGESDDGAEPYALAREVEDARAVLAVAGRGAALLGHSFGGAVALELARAAEPGEVGALVVYEPAAGVGARVSPQQLDRLRRLVADDRPEQVAPLAMRLLDDAGLVTADGPLSTLRVKPTAAVRRLAATVRREIAAIAALGDDLDRYATIDVPALLLVGAASPAGAQAVSARLAATLRRVEVVRLAGLGHVAHTAAPDRVAEPIAAFLAGLRGR